MKKGTRTLDYWRKPTTTISPKKKEAIEWHKKERENNYGGVLKYEND